MRFQNIEGQLARWIEELQNYDMELLYRGGRDHGNADGMSQLPDMVELCRGYKFLCEDAGQVGEVRGGGR